MGNKSVRTVNSLQVDSKKHGSQNDTPIQAIGAFNLNFYEFSENEIICFQFPDLISNRIEEVIIPVKELKSRLSVHKHCLNNLLVLWLLPDGHVYDATNIGIEGEWYFIAGGMAENTRWDFTEFHVK